MEEDKRYVGMMNCYFCNKPKGIALDRRIKDTLPREAVYDKEPCDECKKYMEMGIIIISVKDGETDKANPYRTGGWWVVKEDMVKRLLKGELLNDVLKKRVVFVEDSVCDKIGLKKGVLI